MYILILLQGLNAAASFFLSFSRGVYHYIPPFSSMCVCRGFEAASAPKAVYHISFSFFFVMQRAAAASVSLTRGFILHERVIFQESKSRGRKYVVESGSDRGKK